MTVVMTVPVGSQTPLSVLVTILLYQSTLPVIFRDEVKKFFSEASMTRMF